MGTGAFDILTRQAFVEIDGGVDRLHDRIRASCEPAAPHGIGFCLGHHWPPASEKARDMRLIATAVLYLGLTLGANADSPKAIPALEALRDGQMLKLSFHETPVAASDLPFSTRDGDQKTLADYQEKVVILNFWATWCAPCRKEMPSLDRLNQAFDPSDVAVVTLATGRNSPQGIAKFFNDEAIETLTQYRDDGMAIAKDMGVMGLPVTVILDRDGMEIARLTGDAEWDSPSALAIVGALLETD
jgi:thiol-disulfide isomerase/thioredoxin